MTTTKTAPFNPTLLLMLLPGVGPCRYWEWLDNYQDPQAVIDTPADIIPKLGTKAQQLLKEYQQRGQQSSLASMVSKLLDQLDQHQAFFITHSDDTYPNVLREIFRPPPLLFIRGNKQVLCKPQLAIVGTRNPTATGKIHTRNFARCLSQQGFVITSGLALGIDAIAHQSTIDRQGETIAVMATGIDSIYPKRHHHLADEIIANGGALITEFFPGSVAKAGHFPRRNRIISGLSLGTLVIEAALKSGSLITARFALEQNREVFALPGSINSPVSKGNHWLIKQGACLTETFEDILSQLDGLYGAYTEPMAMEAELLPKLLDNEQTLLTAVGHEPTAIEQLIERTQWPAADVCATLLALELKGYVQQSALGVERLA